MIEPTQPGPVTEKGALIYLTSMAIRRGWYLNGDLETRHLVVQGIVANWNNHAAPYCPCRLTKEEEDICPCDEAAEAIEQHGSCPCMLFVAGTEPTT